MREALEECDIIYQGIQLGDVFSGSAERGGLQDPLMDTSTKESWDLQRAGAC